MAYKFKPTVIIYYILISRSVSIGIQRGIKYNSSPVQIIISVSFGQNSIGPSCMSQLEHKVEVMIRAGILCLIVEFITGILLIGPGVGNSLLLEVEVTFVPSVKSVSTELVKVLL
jgi:hypothetical protein